MLHPKILSARHCDEALRAIRAHKYDHTDTGIVIPSMRLAIGGVFEVAAGDGPWDVAPNLIVTEGLNHLLSVALAQGAQKTAFFLAPFSGNVAVPATWTGANFTLNATEFTNYTEANRVLWNKGAVAAGAVNNTASPGVFTIGTGGGTIRGMALLEASAKSAVTGVLVAAARLSVDKVMAVSEELRARYSISAVST